MHQLHQIVINCINLFHIFFSKIKRNIDISYHSARLLHLDQSDSMSNTPAVYLPLNLRSGAKYKSLSKHKYSVPEMLYLCQQIQEDMEWDEGGIANFFQTLSGRRISKSLLNRHGISQEKLVLFFSVYADGERSRCSDQGHPEPC